MSASVCTASEVMIESSWRMLTDFAHATAEASAEEGPQCDAIGVADQ